MLFWLRNKGLASTFPCLSPFGSLFHMGAVQGTKTTHTSSSSPCRVLVKHIQISPLPPRLTPCPSAFSPN